MRYAHGERESVCVSSGRANRSFTGSESDCEVLIRILRRVKMEDGRAGVMTFCRKTDTAATRATLPSDYTGTVD
jgi:hypothetical protein